MKHLKMMIKLTKISFEKLKISYIITALTYSTNVIVLLINVYVFEFFISSVQNISELNGIFASFFLLVLSSVAIQAFDGLNVIMINRFVKKLNGCFTNIFSLVSNKIDPISYEDTRFNSALSSAKEGIKSVSLTIIMILSITFFYIPYFLLMSLYFLNRLHILVAIIPAIIVPVILSYYLRMRVFSKFESYYYGRRQITEYYSQLLQDNTLLYNSRLNNNLTYIIDKFKYYEHKLIKEKNKIYNRVFKYDTFLKILSSSGYAIGLVVLISSAINKNVSIAVLSTSILQINKIFSFANQSVDGELQSIFDNRLYVEYYYNFIFNNSFLNNNLDNIQSKKNCDYAVLAENIYFRYPGSNLYTLQNISIKIKRGSRIAIVGPNGSGKTTLSKLLIGLYKPSKGTMYINVDNTCITAIFQKYNKYKLTLKDNIIISNPNLSDSTLNNLMQDVDLKIDDNFNLKTVLSADFGGIDISEGMWQKVILLRAISKEFDFIVMDEPTAALDPFEELNHYVFVNNLLPKDIIVIFVTHRLASIHLSDFIIYMEQGSIVESGTHNELIKLNGKYKNMYNKQKEMYN